MGPRTRRGCCMVGMLGLWLVVASQLWVLLTVHHIDLEASHPVQGAARPMPPEGATGGDGVRRFPGASAAAMHGVLPELPDLPGAEGTALNREVPDHRPLGCAAAAARGAPGAVRTTVVMVVAPEEKALPVLRTVHSVLNRSPPALLAEVLLVDDTGAGGVGPAMGWAAREADHLIGLPKVRVVPRGGGAARLGMLGGRAVGAAAVRSAAVTFLESHAEVQPGCAWLAPVLARRPAPPRPLTPGCRAGAHACAACRARGRQQHRVSPLGLGGPRHLEATQGRHWRHHRVDVVATRRARSPTPGGP